MLRFQKTAMHLLGGMATIALVTNASAAHPQTPARLSVELPAQRLGESLRALALLSGRTILADATLVGDRQAPAVHGSYTVDEALHALLDGSGLSFDRIGGSFVVRASQKAADPQVVSSEQDILVTGTRIRGAGPIGSNVVTVDRKEIDRSGYSTTQQLLAAVPQNFGGGANEGTVGFSVRNNSGTNFGFGSGINLRGLGTTSTLTLIDGNRPPLGGGAGSFVDLTLIPSSVIDRIEILADGASAIYGSDAVAGVVNVRLRRDLDGAETRLRYGFADGFDEVQASQLVGFHWASGRFIAGYEYYRRGRLGADDRPYAYPFFPQVLVHAPLITRRAEAPDDPIPHVFDEGRTEYPSLCLFDPAERGWDSSRAIAATTIPWAADWLRFYEAWQATGVWTGGGRDHFIPGPDDPGDPVGTPTIAADNRAARLIGTSASRALLARATASIDAVDPLHRLHWADVPGTDWARRAIRSALPFVHDGRIAA